MNGLIECGLCGSEAHLVTEERRVQVGKRSAVVEDQFYRCVTCGEELYDPSQMDEVMKRASAAIRTEAGLLQPEEILQIRSDLGITQVDFERMLRVGPKTVVRWERGTVFQNQATDVLLRAVRDFPGFADYLALQSGVSAPVDPHHSGQLPVGPRVQRDAR